MKKILAILLAMMLVLVNVAVLADEVDPDDPSVISGDTGDNTDTPPIPNGQSATAAQVITITKLYTFDVTDEASIPADKVEFTVDGEVTDSTTVTEAPEITIDPIEIDEADLTDDEIANGKEYDLNINLPAFDEVGVYTYKVTETIGKVVGVTYTPNEYVLIVTVIRDEDGNLTIAGLALREDAEGAEKTDTIENSYAGADLTVGKEVTGNMGDRQAEWDLKVTFTAEDGMTVGNTIKYTPVGDDSESTIAGGWTGSKDVTVTVKHDESVTFYNLPSGIKYTVEETNPDATYDAPEGEVTTATALTESTEVTVTNNKEIIPDTGIELETLPFVLLMGIALCGVVTLRRREDY